MWITTEFILTRLKHAVYFATHSGATYPGLWYLLGRTAEAIDLPERATAAYARAITAADRSRSRRMFRVRQQWQYRLERVFHETGQPRVDDPLFFCRATAEPATCASAALRRKAPGHFEAIWDFRGLRIDGFLDPEHANSGKIRVLLDGTVLREVPVTNAPWIPPYFHLTLQRSTIARFPKESELRLELSDGAPLLFKGCCTTRVLVPHGTGEVHPQSLAVDKKGFLQVPGNTLQAHQAELLQIYEAARRTFAREFELPLLLLYGTLLGFERDGGFIPGDDDFDVGYISEHTTPEEVKREAMRIVVQLVRLGFTVSFNRTGRLFRLRLPSNNPDAHLDVHSVWFERGATWIHPQAKLDCDASTFIPTRRAAMGGVAVDVPANPQRVLSAYYGDGWRTPDPSYSSAAMYVSPAVSRHLARALVTPAEVMQMQHKIEQVGDGVHSAGQLISIGSCSLYPLEEYERYCDW